MNSGGLARSQCAVVAMEVGEGHRVQDVERPLRKRDVHNIFIADAHVVLRARLAIDEDLVRHRVRMRLRAIRVGFVGRGMSGHAGSLLLFAANTFERCRVAGFDIEEAASIGIALHIVT